MVRTGLATSAALASLVLAACSVATEPTSAAPSSAPASQSSATPAGSPDPATGAIVTIRTTGDEEYRVLLIDAAEIATAEELAEGERDPLIPVGTIMRTDDGGVNTGYGWHIDPASFEWAEMTMELCDGRPSYVEDGTLSGDIFCPWSAEVVGVEPGG